MSSFNNKEGKLYTINDIGYHLFLESIGKKIDDQKAELVENNNLNMIPAASFGSTPFLLTELCDYGSRDYSKICLYGSYGTSLNDTNIQEFVFQLAKTCTDYLADRKEKIYSAYILVWEILGIIIGGVLVVRTLGYLGSQVYDCYQRRQYDRVHLQAQKEQICLSQIDANSNSSFSSVRVDKVDENENKVGVASCI